MKYILLICMCIATTAHAGQKKELECLAKNIYHEARGESTIGQYAVADVTMNRKSSSKYPDTICKVVYQYRQFSWTLDEQPIYESRAWKRSLKIASDALAGYYRGMTNGALWYHEESIKPRWTKRMNVEVIINRHIFYTAMN